MSSDDILIGNADIDGAITSLDMMLEHLHTLQTQGRLPGVEELTLGLLADSAPDRITMGRHALLMAIALHRLTTR